MTSKSILALAGAAALLAGCATGPYYDAPYGNYAYSEGNAYYYDRPTYRYYEPPPYYAPYYYGPSVGLGFSFSNRGYGRRH